MSVSPRRKLWVAVQSPCTCSWHIGHIVSAPPRHTDCCFSYFSQYLFLLCKDIKWDDMVEKTNNGNEWMSWTTCTGRSTVLRYDAKRRAVSLQQLRFYYSSPSIAHRPTYSVLCAWSSTIRFRIANWFIAWLKSSRSRPSVLNIQIGSCWRPSLKVTWHPITRQFLDPLGIHECLLSSGSNTTEAP